MHTDCTQNAHTCGVWGWEPTPVRPDTAVPVVALRRVSTVAGRPWAQGVEGVRNSDFSAAIPSQSSEIEEPGPMRAAKPRARSGSYPCIGENNIVGRVQP